MILKEDFEKAFEEEAGMWSGREKAFALWAAKWMAIYLIDKGFVNDADIQSLELLAKELE